MGNNILKMGGYLWIQMLMVLYFVAIGFLMALPITEAKLCTKRVKVTNHNVKKIPMTKKIPAQCSNWDRAWTWITKMDCGTKYVIEYVELTTHIKEHYKIEYGCCPGDTDCIESEASKQGIKDSDERFLAITFGSATALLTILIIIITISICYKQRLGFCRRRSQYESAHYQETSDIWHHDALHQNEYICGELKTGNSEYEEIRDIPSVRWPAVTNMNQQSYCLAESEKGKYFQSNITQKGCYSVDTIENAHKPPEPSAPLLETLSEKYVDDALVSRFPKDSKESKTAQCTDDMNYIAISNSNDSFQNGSRVRNSEISFGAVKIDTNDEPGCRKSAIFSFPASR